MQELTFEQVEVVSGGFFIADNHNGGSGQQIGGQTGSLLQSIQDDIDRVCGSSGGKVTGGSVTTTGTQNYDNASGQTNTAGVEGGTKGLAGSLGQQNSKGSSNSGSATVTVQRDITCNN